MRLINLNEKKLTDERRQKLPDSAFGVPETRSYPMPDKEHVLYAIQTFDWLKDKSKEDELAANIIKMVKKYKMESEVNVTKKNRFHKYWQAEQKSIEKK